MSESEGESDETRDPRFGARRRCGVSLLAAPAFAADVPSTPTFHKDVEPILQENCQACHRQKPLNMSGMIAPFSLTSYDEARPWAKAIAKAVESKLMPPWGASENSTASSATSAASRHKRSTPSCSG